MAKEKRELIDHVGILPEGQEGVDWIAAKIGAAWGDKSQRWNVYFPVPKNQEEAKTRYDCDLSDLVAAGVRQFSTRPDYLDAGFDYEKGADKKPRVETARLKAKGQALMQDLADAYKVGARMAADSTKIKKSDLADLRARESAFSECTRLILAGKLTRKTAEAWLTERGIDPSAVFGNGAEA